MIPVCWLWMNEEPHNGFWDWGLLNELFSRSEFEFENHHTDILAGNNFAVVVIPGGRQRHHIDRINRELSHLESCLVIVTSDEERKFPIELLKHKNMKLWLMYGKPGDNADMFLPLGAPDGFEARPTGDKTLDYYFAGQNTHKTRHELCEALKKLPNSKVVETDGFAKGDRKEYTNDLGRTKIAPAPHGTVHPDSFRLYEALESGATPVVLSDPYWDLIHCGVARVSTWEAVRNINPKITGNFDWQGYKRAIRRELDNDIAQLSGNAIPRKPMTVLIPTSPIESHPSTDIIEETIKSVRDRTDSEIIVMADGVREEQEHMRSDYEQYLSNLFCLTGKYDFLVKIYDDHLHQAEMTARTLDIVDSPLILFVEHDAPLCEEIPFEDIYPVLLDDELDVVRFSFESHILDVHQKYTRGRFIHNDVTYVKTTQWSQRPHIARSDYYRQILDKWFRQEKDPSKFLKTMIEDKIHGIAQSGDENPKEWGVHRIGIYAPDGDIKRSYHTDGRGKESKFEETFGL